MNLHKLKSTATSQNVERRTNDALMQGWKYANAFYVQLVKDFSNKTMLTKGKMRKIIFKLEQ